MSDFNDLIEISGCDNPSRRGDVIFVHGLGGHARGTWHPQERHDDNNFWPAWLGEDFPDVGIWSLGYEVEPFKWKGKAMPLADRATNILDLLESYEIGDRPLIFITHSMGGLLVKQMLRSARDFGKWQVIASQTKGFVFLSTPHSGSDMASWIRHIGGILRTTVSVEELEAHHSRLRELNLLYRNDEQFSQVPMLVYCETRPTKGILVVNQTSADPGIKGVIPVPMDFDHISICKVGDKKSQIYRQVKRFIEKNLTTPLPPITLKPNFSTHYEIELDQEQFAKFPSAKNLTSANKKLVSVTSTETVEVFFSYSHRDRDLRDELAKHLKLLERQGVITSWHDRQIGAGKEWQGEINQHLNTARVILLLVSANFLASDYCYDVELKRAMEKHDAGEARVIPVKLSPVDMEGVPFNKLKPLPSDGRPVTEWRLYDKAFADIAQGIRAAVKDLTGN